MVFGFCGIDGFPGIGLIGGFGGFGPGLIPGIGALAGVPLPPGFLFTAMMAP
jgi:hypothetical protein